MLSAKSSDRQSEPFDAIEPLQFGILGPTVIWGPDRERPQFPKGREARLLAALALRPGGPVWRAQLIDAIWGEHLPKSPISALHNVVYRLRNCLVDCGLANRLVEESSTGYVLRAKPEAVDASRFELLVTRARNSRPENVSRWLRRGLGLWRGNALESLTGMSAHLVAAAQRLEALRVVALEKRFEADLACGFYRDAIPELRALTIEFPLSERMYGLLMAALYSADRQSEALRAYREVRNRLVEQIGIGTGTGTTTT